MNINVDLSDPDGQRQGRELARDLIGAGIAQPYTDDPTTTLQDYGEALSDLYGELGGRVDIDEMIPLLLHALQQAARQTVMAVTAWAMSIKKLEDPTFEERVNSDDKRIRDEAIEEGLRERRKRWQILLLDLERDA